MTTLSTILIILISIIFIPAIVYVLGYPERSYRSTRTYLRLKNSSKEFDIVINGETFIIKRGIHDIDFESGFIALILTGFIHKDLNFVSCKLKLENADKIINIINKYFEISVEDKVELKKILAKGKFDFGQFIQNFFITKNKFKNKKINVKISTYTLAGLLLRSPSNLLNYNKEIFTVNIE